TNATKYAKKALALAIVLARNHNFGTPDPSDQVVGLADGARRTFTLPFTPMNAAQVKVVLVATSEIQVTRAAQGSDDLGTFAPIMKVTTVSDGAPAYAPTDYELRYRDGYDVFRLAWITASKPASGANYFVTVADGILNKQVDWCSQYCYENDGTGGNVGNYFIRGLLGGTFATAYATDGENPSSTQLKTQANTLLSQMYEGVVKFIPGGYGPQGQY